MAVTVAAGLSTAGGCTCAGEKKFESTKVTKVLEDDVQVKSTKNKYWQF